MPAAQAELTADLRRHIYEAFGEMRPYDRERGHWVMNPEWFRELLLLRLEAPPSPSGVMRSLPVQLFGIPIEVRDDGGLPHLEI